jgi:hypothetical protein
MNQTMKIIREVNYQAELFYNDAVSMGDHAASALGKERRAQMTSLENIAESTLKSTDVFDFIKKQIARHDDWRKPYKHHTDPKQGFGERLKIYLEKDLPPRTTTVCNSAGVGDEEHQLRREIYLQLIRQFIRQVVVQYEYRVNPVNLDKNTQERKS